MGLHRNGQLASGCQLRKDERLTFLRAGTSARVGARLTCWRRVDLGGEAGCPSSRVGTAMMSSPVGGHNRDREFALRQLPARARCAITWRSSPSGSNSSFLGGRWTRYPTGTGREWPNGHSGTMYSTRRGRMSTSRRTGFSRDQYQRAS